MQPEDPRRPGREAEETGPTHAEPQDGFSVFVVDESRPGERLDVWLRQHLPQVSRGTLQRLIQEGAARVDDRCVKPTHSPRRGERIVIQWPEAAPAEAQPQPIPLDVLFEDDQLVVLNKPPGLVVHPSAGHQDGTLVNALLHWCAGRLSGVGGVARPGIVHRLDKDTSGCLVVAKTDASHQALAEQFSGREVEKTYSALVCGIPPSAHGDIRAAIRRHPTDRKRMTVTGEAGRDAWTSYRVCERLHSSALLEIRIHTGRTHQIRVHFKHLGCPIVGDLIYGPRQNRKLELSTGLTAPRQMLHAFRLSFRHPVSERRLEFEAPWPQDFTDTLSFLRRGTPAAA